MSHTTTPCRVAIAGSGAGSNARALIAYSKNYAHSDYTVDVVITTTETAGIVGVAEEHRIPYRVLTSRVSEEMANQFCAILDEFTIDVLALAGFLRLLPTSVIQHIRGNVLNIHPSLLPRHGGKGMYGRRVHEAVIDSGDQETGATVHLVTENYDEGQIVDSERFVIPPGIGAADLESLVRHAEHRLYPRALQNYCQQRKSRQGADSDRFLRPGLTTICLPLAVTFSGAYCCYA